MYFEGIKTGTQITSISRDVINSLVKIEAFNKKEMNTLLWQYHKELLLESKNKNNNEEVGYFWNLNTFDIPPLKIYGNKEGFSIAQSRDVSNMLKDKRNTCAVCVLHNHPRNGLFSSQDIRSFCDFDTIYLMTAVCNDGTIYMLRKEEKFSPYKLEYFYNEGKEKSEKLAYKERLYKAKLLGLDVNDPNNKKIIDNIPIKSYYYGIKNVGKHQKEIGVTYRCSVKRRV